MIHEFLGKKPLIHPSAHIVDSAEIIGDVTMGEESSAWFNVTIRADVNWIKIGQRSNVQDSVCIHVMNKTGSTFIGNEVTIGHGAVIHGCTIHDRVLIGINATVLDKAVIEPDVIVAAGSLVAPQKVLKSGYLYMGSPAKAVRKLSRQEVESIKKYSQNYVKYSRAYKGEDTYKINPFYTVG